MSQREKTVTHFHLHGFKITQLAGLIFLLAFVFLYVIYGKPSSPCKIKFPEMYSLIFFRETVSFCTTNHQSSLSSHVIEHQKHFVWLTKLSVSRFALFWRNIKKGDSVNTSGLGWTEELGNVIYKQEGVQKGESGLQKTPLWWRTSSSPCGMVPSRQESKFPAWSTNQRMSCERVRRLMVKQVRRERSWRPRFSKPSDLWRFFKATDDQEEFKHSVSGLLENRTEHVESGANRDQTTHVYARVHSEQTKHVFYV